MDDFGWLRDATFATFFGASLFGLYRLVWAFLLGDKNGVAASYRRYVEANETTAKANVELGRHIEQYDRDRLTADAKQTESCNSHAVLLGGVAGDIKEHLRVAGESSADLAALVGQYGDGKHVAACIANGAKVDSVTEAMIETCQRVKAYATNHHPDLATEVSGHCDSIVEILRK